MIPFSPPRMDQAMIDEVVDTLQSGWITTGPKTKRFEKELTAFTGAKITFCVNSATAGMELMLRWFGVGPGDEVILPAYTYCSTANVVMHCGAKPVLVDVGADSNLDVAKIKALIKPNTKAIMPVDIGGLPCDYTALNALITDPEIQNLFQPKTAEQKTLGRVLLLADAAHSLGAHYQGQQSGTLADASVFSFHAVKNLTTAEGGAIAIDLPDHFDHDAIYKQLNTYSLHGQSKDALAKTKTGGWRYDVIAPGYKCNMTDIQASLGLVELARYADDTLHRRAAIFQRYTEQLEAFDWAETPVFETAEKRSSFHVYMLHIKDATEAERDQIIDHISAEKVAVNVHFQPLPLLSAYKEMYEMQDYPVAFERYSKEISLPVFYDLTDEQVDQVVATVKAAVATVLGK